MSDKLKKTLLVNPHVKENISLLSTEADSPNYRGFLNLGAIVLLAVNFRLIIENILKYGILFQDPSKLVHDYLSLACILTYIANIIPVSFSFYLETKLGQYFSPSFMRWIQVLLQIYILSVPVFAISYFKVHFSPGLFLLAFTLIIAMKVYSFSDVMYEVREAYKIKEYLKFPKEIKEKIGKYPNVVSLKEFVYFLFYPTMCFQLYYPKTSNLRITWLLKRIVEYILSLSIMLILTQQYTIPLTLDTISILEQNTINYEKLVENLLKLALPNLYTWLLFFYITFQCFLNIFSEITGFADRNFYNEWWNSRTLGEYWRTWNLPVQNWLHRHVYLALVNKKYNRGFSMLITFILSAVAHEYLLSGVCRTLTYWAFLAMISQMPIIIIMDTLKSQLNKSQIGNVVFWASFCLIGQPVWILIYSYQVYKSL